VISGLVDPIMKRMMTLLSFVVTLVAVAAGSAVADETHRDSHNAPVVALINTGQIDDPMEDVLEHTLNFGDGYKWD
jgi:predicted membrane-bound mannosyltransferase